jgi:hypothetical protein
MPAFHKTRMEAGSVGGQASLLPRPSEAGEDQPPQPHGEAFLTSREVPAGYVALEGDEDGGQSRWTCPADGLPGILVAPEGANVRLVAALYVVHVWPSAPGEWREQYPHSHRLGDGRHWASHNHGLPRDDYPELYEEFIGEVRRRGKPPAPSRLKQPPF